jgi:malate dehydrogenase
VKSVVSELLSRSPDIILILVTNPLDAMVHVARKVSALPKTRIIGMAGVLDSARMRTFVATELGVSVQNVHAFVLGGHGDTMVPLPRFSTVAGIPLTELVQMGYLTQTKLDEICTRTANGGAEITKLVGTSAWYAPGAAAAQMVEAILKDKKSILPCSVFLDGEYGVQGQFLGVPVKIGRGGAEQIIEIRLTDDERAALLKSAAAVKELTTVIGV